LKARKKPVEWIRLDNAAKIFPPTTSDKDTKVFRFVCELKEEINTEILQKALNNTITLFPIFQTVLRRGVFWYYFEKTDLIPVVSEENKLPCSMLYSQIRKNLLFEVTYYKKRINLEMYHAVTDGTGALGFFKTMIYYYLTELHGKDFGAKLPDLDYDASFSQKTEDSYSKYYNGDKKLDHIKLTKAYQIAGRRSIDNRLKVIEAEMSVKEVIDLAHKYDTTLTIYLTALFIQSIFRDMPDRSRKYPVVFSVPVNLRTYFPSATARNFFATVNIKYNYKEGSDQLVNIIQEVKESFAKALTIDNLRKNLNGLSALEHNAFMRVIPLALKDHILRFATTLHDRGITATLSNVGKITITKEFTPYIQMFDCFVSSRRPQISMCSFEDQLVISFTSPFIGTDIQKNFFRMLTQEGVGISIASNSNEV